MRPDTPTPRAGSIAEVFGAALTLGLTSFGGPIAHIGYFERSYVQQRQWLSAEEFSGLVALCQMVPGPASSQLGYLIGLRRAGWAGGLAAWLGFTLPSALLMFGFAMMAPWLNGPVATASLHGLKLVAVAVVAQAVWSMARSLCPDRTRTAIALAALTLLLVVPLPGMQVAALGVGLAGGALLCRHLPERPDAPRLPVGSRTGVAALALFGALLVGLPWLAGGRHDPVGLAALFYRSGALVFGGGHVVLPLLRDALVPTGWLGDSAFLSGYGAAQAMPGPLFTFAAYLGAAVAPHTGMGAAVLWSLLALLAIFLPGALIAVAGVALWNRVGHHNGIRGALAGLNAAVVGVLGAAFYDPVWTSGVTRSSDLAIAVVGFFLLERWRVPPIAMVALTVGACLLASIASVSV
ncbi:MAG: chromate efflux transporter [Sphingomonadales bacterium]|nr:chromate efflux transporter [Sphingomonadales bacterium]MDE2170729.1 chromate efflux transporter [Sphingomonadales bacterium]